MCNDISATYMVAVAVDREGIILLRLSGGVLCGGVGMGSFTPIAADACVRSVVAASMWCEGKVVGVDDARHIFLLHTRLDTETLKISRKLNFICMCKKSNFIHQRVTVAPESTLDFMLSFSSIQETPWSFMSPGTAS